MVTSLAEVWIEIVNLYLFCMSTAKSLPLRKCGLKYYDVLEELELTGHFLAEVWIEISNNYWIAIIQNVTSLAEVWIEIILMSF